MEIVNRVAQSGIITLDLETLIPEGDRVQLDIAPWLFEGIILKEELFRKHVQEQNWEIYKDKFVAINCSEDAVIPLWAYMLVSIHLSGLAGKVVFGDISKLNEVLFHERLMELDPETYKDQRVVIKGCSRKEIPPSAYVDISFLLKPVVKSLMFGEPCSTVPLYKKKRTEN